MKTQYCILTTVLKDDGLTIVEEFGSGEFPKLESAVLQTIKSLTAMLVEKTLFSNKHGDELALDVINGVVKKVKDSIKYC